MIRQIRNRIPAAFAALFLAHAGLLALPQGVRAQSNPGDNVFAGLKAHDINVVFNRPWSEIEPLLKANKEAEIYLPARLEINCIPQGNPDCVTMDSVGVRHKGNSTFSQSRQKNPFRFSFDEYGIDQRWDGMKGFVLNNGWNDGAFVREKVHLDLAWRAGIPGPRATFTWLHINGEPYAFYILVELADKRLLQSRFGDKDGDRFKATDIVGNTRRSDFTRRSPFTPQAYHGYYENNSDDTTRGWERMARFIDTLNLTPENTIAEVLPRIVNVNDLYRALGLDAMLSSTDNYPGPAQNFNVYFPTEGGPMRWILWDVSLTLGSTSVSYVRTVSARPLLNRFTGNEALREDYLRAIWFLYHAHVADNWIVTRVHELEAFALPHLNADTRKLTSVTASGFNTLRSAITTRRTHANSQFASNNITAANAIRNTDVVINEIAPTQGWIEVFNNRDYVIDLSGHALSNDAAQPNKWTFTLGSFVAPRGYRKVRLQGGEGTDTATNFTLPAGGGHLRLSRANGTVVDSVTYGTVLATRTHARVSDGTGAFVEGVPTPGTTNVSAAGMPENIAAGLVRINEFMANNDTIVSPAGIKADWIELYNTTSSSVNLAGMYLSDNATNPAKWQFPTGTSIPANGYLVVWAYDTTVSGSLYTSWALSKDGEHIRLSNANLSVMDSVTFGAQTKNRTMARIPNGTGNFSSSCLPTLGMANTCIVTGVAGSQINRDAAGLTLARGAAGRITVGFALPVSAQTRLAVQDARGREVAVLHNGPMAAGEHARAFDAGSLPSGSYWVVLRSGATESVRSVVLLR